jgi:cyd operon protein YbgT
MWYFTWILGLGLALSFGIINAMWLEASYAFGELDAADTRRRFESRSQESSVTPVKS